MVPGNSKEAIYEEGLNQYNTGEAQKAIGYYRKCIELASREVPADFLFIFNKCTELAQIYLESNQLQDVSSYTETAFSTYQDHLSLIISSDDSADFLELLGNLTFFLERFDKATICYSGAESLYPDFNNKNLARAKKCQARSRQGDFVSSISELETIISLEELNIETRNKVRKCLADIMVLTCQYEEALELYRKIFSELKQKYKLTTYWLLETLFNMATSNFELGNYGTAINQYKQVVSEIELNKFPGSDRLKMQSLLMIAKISIIISDSSEAVRLLKSVNEDSLLENDKIYYQLLLAQIELFNIKSDQEGSRKYLNSILSYEIGKIENHKDAAILTMQCNYHLYEEDKTSSIAILHRLINYYRDTHDVYQVIIYTLHLCQILSDQEMAYQKSEILLRIREVKEFIGNDTRDLFLIMTRIKLSKLYYGLYEFSDSYESLSRVYTHQWELISSYVLSGEKEQHFFMDNINLLLNITLAASKKLNFEKIELRHQYLSLYIKLKTLFMVKSEVFRGLIHKTDIQGKDLILRYYQKLKELNSQTFNKSEHYHKLKMEVNSLENIIKRETGYFDTIREIINIEWQDISEMLDSNEAAISFIRYEGIDDSISDGSGYSVFLILNGSRHPCFFDLEINDDFLKELLPFYLLRNYESGGSFYMDVEIPILSNLTTLYERIFKPLEISLNGINKIYFTVDGLLNYVPFGALLSKKNEYVMDKFEIIQLQNLRDIKGRETEKVLNSIAIFGGIDFGRYHEESSELSMRDDNSLSAVGQIAKAGYENKEISELFGAKECQGYLSDHLDLADFRNMCAEKRPSCIHILTHGFFFNDEQKKYNFEDIYQYNTFDIRSHANPLLRSGIFASGYNNFLSSTNVKPDEKGVITSYDISRSQLENTFLVTIHACESALGAVRSGETFGLARAFMIAGVKCIILTLWKIQYTGFYINFYRHLLEDDGKDVRKSFDAAILDIRKEYPNPYWWSGFVLIQ